MPTANRLVAAICLAIIGAIVAELVKPLMPEGAYFGPFTYVSAAIGFCVGWVNLGPRAGGGTAVAINNGLTSVIVLVVVGLLGFGSREMLRQALRHRYTEPMEALRGVLEIAMGYGSYLLDIKIIAVLIIGGIVSGLATETAFRRWR